MRTIRLDNYKPDQEGLFKRFTLKRPNFLVRLAPNVKTAKILMFLIVEFNDYEIEDEDHAWVCIGEIDRETPFHESALPKLVHMWFTGGMTELRQEDVERVCLPYVISEASSEDRRLASLRAHDFSESLSGVKEAAARSGLSNTERLALGSY
jgi:hypothetical protein